MKRLLRYLKPHKLAMTSALILVVILIVLELYRPIIIGDAIDEYINAYDTPYIVAESEDDHTVYYGDIPLTQEYTEEEFETAENFYQLYLFEDHYYLFQFDHYLYSQVLKNVEPERMSLDDGILSVDVDIREIYIEGDTMQGIEMSESQLKELRRLDAEGITQDSILYLVVLVANMLCNAASIWVLQKMGQDIVYEMRNEVFTHIHSLSLSFFNTQPVGKLVTRVSNDTESVNELFTTVLVKLFRNVLKIVGFAVVMLSINVKMTAYAFMMLPFVGALTFFFRYMSRKAYRIVRNRLTDVNTFLSENLSGMKLIQIFTREKEKYEEFEEKNKNLYNGYFREVMTFAIFRPSLYLTSVIALVIIIGFGSKFTLEGTLTLGTLFIFINYIKQFFEPIQELAEQFGTLQSSLASAEKIFSILDEKPVITNSPKPLDVERLNGEIEFKNVWFAYEDEEYVLKDVNFTIKPGEKVAFVGATGAGKTSILNLIGRYFDIQKGQILIDGMDIKDIHTDVLRGSIGQVQQDVFIFTGDIAGNISLNNESITREEIIEAAKYVNADNFIQKLPGGYDEPVTERGSTLSAGQRQLLSFARTLAYKPSILVLDEATANIDTETESLITEALGRLMEGRTTIMVAHRLSTIQHADKIMVMDHGEIEECGSHQELLAQGGIYSKLYELQLATQE